MFKKLKTKLLLINMVLLTAVFMGIFGAIYLGTAYSMEKDISMQLLDNMIPSPIQKPMSRDSKINMTIKIDLDIKNKIIAVSSKVNMDELDINNIVKEIINNKRDLDTIIINNEKFKYLKKDIGNGKRIVLMSKSFQDEMLSQLLRTFIAVGILSLIVLFFISLYFTNKAINPLEETFKKQKQFIADASHELRTPLAIIKTNISLLKENDLETIKSQRKWLDYIDSQSNRMSTLINEMLSLANLDVKRNGQEKININLSKMLSDILLVFEVIIFEKGLILEEKIKDNIFINAESNQIKKLISILMDNAIKYTNDNGKISVSLITEKNRAKLIIKNTGEGIRKEHLEKIFERFYRVDKARTRKMGGTGLGLSIAKEVLDQNSGRIDIKSVVNSGTEVVITLPTNINKVN